MILKDFHDLKINRIYNPGDIKISIKKLEASKDVVVKQADKGGAIVIQSKKVYKEEELDQQLCNEEMYQKLLSNPTLRYKNELAKVIQKGVAKGLLNKKEGRYLQPNGCKKFL